MMALAALAGCGREAPWDSADWRPERPPQRIVAGSLLAAEVLLEIAPHDRIAGVIGLAADPQFSLVVGEVAGLPLVGAEPEQLLAVRPDLVITDAFTRSETRALLRAAGVPMLRTADAGSFDEIAANIRSLGRVCHLEAEAEALVRRMFAELAEVRAAAADFAHWNVCCLDGLLHTYGRGSLIDAMIAAAGPRNLASAHGAGAFRRLDLETVLGWRPDALLIGVPAGGEDGAGAWLQQKPGLPLLPCVQNERLIFVPGPLLSTTSHRLVQAARLVQATLRQWGPQ
jgi:iron complex transport system substrate-binding protein